MVGRFCAVVLVLDGCSLRAISAADMPNLRGLIASGSYSVECRSIHPSATYPAHATIVTGAYPEEHGIVGNEFLDRRSGKFVNLDAADVNAYLERETLMEKAGVASAAIGEPVTRGASEVVAKADVQSRPLRAQDEYAMERAMEVIREVRPGLVFVNLPGVDALGERHGPASEEVIEDLRRVDELLGQMTSLLGEVYEDWLLVAVADHGMTPVRRYFDLRRELERMGAKACVSHRAAHVYVLDADVDDVARGIRELGIARRVARRGELESLRLGHDRSGDIYVTAAAGVELGTPGLRGSHGGEERDEFHVLLAVSRREYSDALSGSVDLTAVARVVERYLLERRAIEAARSMLSTADPAHGWAHTERVLRTATELAIRHGADVKAVRLACIFHDAGRGADPRGHEERSARIAERFLVEAGCGRETVERVRRAILMHHADPRNLKTLEEAILWDADKLDALGLIGLARCLLEEGHRGGGLREAVEHLLRDVKAFVDAMHFPETRREAARRVRRVLEAVEELLREDAWRP